jgi:hypothetical protein
MKTVVQQIIDELESVHGNKQALYLIAKCDFEEIFKEQIIKAYAGGCADTEGQEDANSNYSDKQYGEDYYTKTYKNEPEKQNT